LLGVFRSFLGECRKAYPYLYDAGEFEPLADMFEELSNETTACGIRISDMAVELSRKPSELYKRIYFLDMLVKDLKELGSPQAVCEQRLNNR